MSLKTPAAIAPSGAPQLKFYIARLLGVYDTPVGAILAHSNLDEKRAQEYVIAAQINRSETICIGAGGRPKNAMLVVSPHGEGWAAWISDGEIFESEDEAKRHAVEMWPELRARGIRKGKLGLFTWVPAPHMERGQ